MNLEQLIDDAYGKHQAELKAIKEAEELRQKQWVNEAISAFRTRLDEVIPAQVQSALGIKIHGFYDQPAYAEFEYRGESITIVDWGLRHLKAIKNGDHLVGGEDHNFLNSLLIALGKIRESEEPDEMMSDEAIADLMESLGKIATVRDHKRDLLNNFEEFGNDLDTAIELLKKAVNRLVDYETGMQ